MKAFFTQQYGEPVDAAIADLEAREPGPGEVRVRVAAASVNPLDLKVLAGYMQAFLPIEFPYTIGTDLAGTVDAIGPLVEAFAPGDRVFGRTDPNAGGAFAQMATLPAHRLAPMPAAMSFEQAAATPTAAGTAWLNLFDQGGLRPGQTVLVHAGAGGVGHIALQLAHQVGARVITTASTANHDRLANLGADEVIDYRETDFTEVVSNIDLVIDTIGGDVATRSRSVVKPGGTLLSLVDPETASDGDVDARFVFFGHDSATLANLAGLFAAGRLQLAIDGIHPLAEARAALERVAGGHARGKVIVTTSR